MKKIFFVVFLFLCGLVHAQQDALIKPARVIFYNTENLFDTIDDPKTNDEEFLPQSKLHWNTEKYRTKLEHIAKVLAAMLDTIQPLVIGLSEVENRKVLQDLLAQKPLKKYHFGIIHHDSPDPRGIDVALLYNKEMMNEPFDAFLSVRFPFAPEDRTRDIVYLKGYVNESDPLWIFVNHWPSRRGGADDSEKKRLVAEKVLRDKIDDIFKGEPNARVIVMGDFNDNPIDESLQDLSSTKTTKIPAEETLANLMKPLYQKGEFTLKYRDENDVFDQFIVSENLLNNRDSYYVRNSSAHIFKPGWILFKHPKYGWIPNRTYSYDRWVKGYSDHLPVYMDIVFR